MTPCDTARCEMRIKTEDDMLHELIDAVERYKSDAEAARAFGVSRSHMSRIVRGLKPITAKIAHCLGYETQRRFVAYEYRE
jgi:plasmid maintenance system antidote protein VapI